MLDKVRVLVVDDDESVAETLGLVLNFAGFDAAVAGSGEAAIALARQHDYDVLVTDVMMEPMNGIQTALAVRQICPQCCVFLISGNPRSALVLASAIEAGHDFPIVAKPVHPSELIQLLHAECPKVATSCSVIKIH